MIKKISRYFIILLFLLPFLLPFGVIVYEGFIVPYFDYAKITDINYTAIVVDEPDSNGKIIVKEEITFDINALSEENLFWELWRDLPEDTIDGLKVDYNVISVNQILSDGTKVEYEESDKLYWDDSDYTGEYGYGAGYWYHSEGPYSEYGRDYECVFFYVDGLYKEEITFEIYYEMNNAVLRYNDCSELYLCMYSEETIKDLNSFEGTILIPNDDMPQEGNYEAYTYGTSYGSFDFTESDSINEGYYTFNFKLDNNDLKFGSYDQFIEFSLISYGDDKYTFSEYANRNLYYYYNVLDELRQEQLNYEEEYKNAQTIKIIVFLVSSILSIFIFILGLKRIKKIKNKNVKYEAETPFEFFREIPSDLDPHFAANLVFCKENNNKADEHSYSAILMSLVRKKYIELVKINENKEWVSRNIKIVVLHKPIVINQLDENNNLEKTIVYDESQLEALEKLSPTEDLYYNLILRHSNKIEVTMEKFQSQVAADYDNTNNFVNNIENSITTIGIKDGYFQKADYKELKNNLKRLSSSYMKYAVFILIFGNLILYSILFNFAYGAMFMLAFSCVTLSLYAGFGKDKYILLTQYGENEFAKWRGLYNFLNSETLISERSLIELPLWEKYLIYATAFGVSDKVIKALKIRCPELESSIILKNSYYISNNFHTRSRSFRTATRRASGISRSGSHGSYGGGGRGGGGGGGGH